MVGSVMILLVLFECSLKVGGVDRHHLMRRPMLADSRQVDERCDAPPRELGDALDRVLVMVDAVAPGRPRRLDVGQSEGRGEADDSLGSPASHDQSPKEVCALSVISSEPEGPQSCQSIQGKRRRAFEGRMSDDIPRALGRRRSKSKIQEWMTASETASQTGQIKQYCMWALIEFRTRRAIAFAPHRCIACH